jgi:co-chaperonin GroES (HSP10)
MQPICDKILVEMVKSTHDFLILPDCYVEPTRLADVIGIGERVNGISIGDRVIMMEGVRGYPTDYGRVVKEEWVLGVLA